MNITNGTVSRTYKPADYEGRTVTFSFTLEPADDADVETAKIAYLAEKHARHMPNPNTGQELVAEPAKRRTRAPSQEVVQPLPEPGAAAAEVAAQQDPFGAAGATAQSALASAPASATVSNSPAPTPAAEITDAMLQDAIKAKVASDAKHTAGVMELIHTFTGDPLAKIYTVKDQFKRSDFLDKLSRL